MFRLILRPHHLLCIQKFTGHGYSPEFTAGMTETVQTLRGRPETAVTLVCGADVLCAHCPHCKDGCCASAEKTAAMDSAVLAVIGQSAGEWRTLSDKARRQILQTDRFQTICGSCQWFGLCCETEVFS